MVVHGFPLFDVSVMCRKNFSFMMSYLVMSFRDRFHVRRKGGARGGGWVHLKCVNSTAVSGLRCERSLVRAG